MTVRLDGPLDESDGGGRQSQQQSLRPEGNEVVEAGLYDVAPFVLVRSGAGAEIVVGDTLRARFLDLMTQEQRAGRQALNFSGGERGKADAEALMTERAAMRRRNRAIHLERAEAQPRRIVLGKQRHLPVERPHGGIEGIP